MKILGMPCIGYLSTIIKDEQNIFHTDRSLCLVSEYWGGVGWLKFYTFLDLNFIFFSCKVDTQKYFCFFKMLDWRHKAYLVVPHLWSERDRSYNCSELWHFLEKHSIWNQVSASHCFCICFPKNLHLTKA